MTFNIGDKVRITYEVVHAGIAGGPWVTPQYLEYLIKNGAEVEVIESPLKPGDYFSAKPRYPDSRVFVGLCTEKGYLALTGFNAGQVNAGQERVFSHDELTAMGYVKIDQAEAFRRAALTNKASK